MTDRMMLSLYKMDRPAAAVIVSIRKFRYAGYSDKAVSTATRYSVYKKKQQIDVRVSAVK